MNIYNKIKIYKKNLLYPYFLSLYPGTYCFNSNKLLKKIDFLNDIYGDILIYLHIPFCTNICKFCNVYKLKIDNYNQIKEYIYSLEEELRFFSNIVKNKRVKGIYIGGGTPTILNVKDLKKIFNLLRKYFIVNKQTNIEIDVYPSTLSKEKLDLFKKNGVNQLSIGVQSMESTVLNNISRFYQTKEILNNLLGLLKNYSFNLHFDFVIGLPGEKIHNILNGIEYIVESFSPYSISINGYDNTIDTLLYKEYKDYFSSKEYLKRVKNNKIFLHSYIYKKYGIRRFEIFLQI